MKAAVGLLALAVIAIGVVAAITLSHAPAAPVASSSTQTSATTSVTMPVGSGSESTTTPSSTSESANPSQLSSLLAKNITAASQFFSHVRAFTITIGSGTGPQLASTTQSWSYVGSPTINGTSYTEVSVSCSGSQSCQYPSPYTLWVADNGSIPLIQYGGHRYQYNYTVSSGGPTIGLEEMLGYSVAPYLSGSFPSSFVLNGTGSFQAGTAQIPIYTWLLSSPITYRGTTVSQASITLGVIPGGYSILTRLVIAGTSNGTGANASVEVTSLTLA